MADVPHQEETASPEERILNEHRDQQVDSENYEAPHDLDEEEECRVCRGPSEEGRPLFAPCKCSGSIGLTHQDCLSSWLSMTRGDGRCELCGTKFQFAPKYAEGTPDQLPPYEVFLGLSRRALAKWLPFALRFVIAMSLWLLLVPLITAYLYHGWMHRPSSIATRWKWELVAGDMVSGAVIAAVIIVSFLSLMSFGDFLRFHLHDDAPAGGGGQAAAAAGGGDGNDANDGHVAADEEIVIDEIVPENANERDNSIHLEGADWRLAADLNRSGGNHRDGRGERPADTIRMGDIPGDPEEQRVELRRRIRAAALLRRQLDNIDDDADEILRLQEREAELNERLENAGIENERRLLDLFMGQPNEVNDQEAARVARMMQAQEERGDDGLAHDERRNVQQDLREGLRRVPRRNNDGNEQPFIPRDPMMNLDDPGDVDINVALDELLGLGAPFSALIRNLLWLLAFNTTYLGIFAFIPRTLGEVVYTRAFNSTSIIGAIHRIPYMKSEDGEGVSVLGALSDLNGESARLNTTLQLPDMSIIVMGYFFMAFLVLMWQWGLFLCRRFLPSTDERRAPAAAQQQVEREAQDRLLHNDVRRAFDENFDRMDAADEAERDQDGGFDRAFLDGPQHPDEDIVGQVGEKLALAIECSSAVVKVGVLLFFKMLLLPLVLGIWLDAATLELFETTGQDRIIFAGRDVFGSVLLHWVVGITFMLLVTVSVLQLREVAHPDLLAPVIRPQEPQPDLLGNLLHEKGTTHAKRMLVSLGIYAALLTIHVWVPARVLISTGIGNHLPFFHPKFWHVLMPQLQIPLELIVFHLCMLAFLEKYKNHIGEMQHRWLSFMCDKMGLTDYIMPQTVEKFRLVGTRPVFLQCCADDNKDTSVEQSPGDSLVALSESETSACTSSVSLTRKPEVDPFWYELAVAAKGSNVDEYILANNQELHVFKVPMYQKGKRKANGARVLSYPESHIRLPTPFSHRGEAKQSHASGSATKYLLPTTVGSYRLRKKALDDGSIVIQFWQEVRGEPIPRPPEGWDDLGVGGAEVQGRWAWLKEKKSDIEESVAARTPFFGLGRSRLSSLYAVGKFLFLLCLSWLASSVVVCCALSLPLFIGRFVLLLLRVPDRCVHDPLAFAIGGSILFPVVIMGSDILAKPRGDSSWKRFLRWVISFRLPPVRKLLVFMQATILWLIVSPLCLGLLYDLILVKSRSWFSLDEPLFDLKSSVLSWGVGMLLLNVWAILCYLGAFTGNFWVEIGVVLEVQQDDPPGDREEALDREPVAPANGGEHQTEATANGWQGKKGRIARFFRIISAVLFRWEWDRVDPVHLLEETAVPVAKHLASCSLLPVAAYALWLVAVDSRNDGAGIVLPLAGVIDKGLYRMIIFRTFAAFALTVQLASSFQGPLQRWFRAAHKAARDDRYLVGEVLMNYDSSTHEEGRTRRR